MTVFALPSSAPRDAELRPIGEGLHEIACTNALSHYRVLTQGAQLLSWQPAGEPEVVWTSPHARFLPGKPPRGGTPICWPWFGPHSNPDYPAHGLVRAKEWSLESFLRQADGTDILHFSTTTTDDPSPLWPHHARLDVTYHLGSSLLVTLETSNLGKDPITITEAVHTYFGVGDVREISIHGLSGSTYLDRLEADARKPQSGAIVINSETDRVYLATAPECSIIDPVLKRTIHISSTGGRSKVVWNPWNEKAAKLGDLGDSDYLQMVCVESGNIADDAVVIAGGERHALQIRYTTTPQI
jgi:glucose-6-phosphate 1-epimerase